MLTWARENGCPWDGHICSNAARGGHFEVLKWAKANGCRVNPVECKKAADEGLRGFVPIPGPGSPQGIIPKISAYTHKAITEWITANEDSDAALFAILWHGYGADGY